MGNFVVDLLTGKQYLFNVEISGGTPISGSTYPEVNLYSDLPAANTVTGEIYVVRTSSGDYVKNRKERGFYFSNGTSWILLPNIVDYFNSTNFKIFDNDNDKGIQFITSGITNGSYRKITAQNSDGTVAYLSDVSPKLNTTLFNQYTGTTLNEFKIVDTYAGNGIIQGFKITINADNTKINISSGIGYFYNNHNDPTNPTKTRLVFSGKTGQTLTYLNTDLVTYLAIDSSGNIIQKTSLFDSLERRSYIILGAAIHSNKINVNAINNLPDVVLDAHSQFNDLIDSLRNFNVDGNVFGAYDSTLSIVKSEGKIFKRGVNFDTDNRSPHIKILPELIAPSNIRYRLSDSTEYPDTNVVSKYYESEPGVRTALQNNDFTLQRISIFPSNLVRIQYGQAVYKSLIEAQQAIYFENFVIEKNISENGLLRAYLIIRGGTTSLNNPNDARFIETDKFGTMPLGGGSISVPATNVTVTPTGNISSIDAQSALAELDAEKLSITSFNTPTWTPSQVYSITGSTGITTAMINNYIIRISGSTGATIITKLPNIAAGSNGQVIILKGNSNTNTVTLQSETNLSGSKLKLDGGINFTLGLGDILQLYYDSVDGYWYEISRKNNL